MGKQHLWVDPVCIDQSNEVEKFQQSGIMSDIYQGAYATLVAFSGASANAGLPMVGPTRTPYRQLKCDIDGTQSLWIRPNVVSALLDHARGEKIVDLSRSRPERDASILANSTHTSNATPWLVARHSMSRYHPCIKRCETNDIFKKRINCSNSTRAFFEVHLLQIRIWKIIL